MANYLKHGTSQSSKKDEAQEMLRSRVPLSERPRDSYGSLLMSAQAIPGLCSRGRKCVLKDGHTVACWPEEN